jgi:Tfp pilus assembly protein PilF
MPWLALWLAVTPLEEGLALAQRGAWALARERLQVAVQQEPKNALAWKALGVAAGKTDDTGSSEEAFRRACELNAQLADVCYYRARALYVLNRFEPALAALESVLKIDPRRGRTWTAIGQAREALGQAEPAEAAFRKALTQPDAGAEARQHFGVFLFRAGRLEEAARMLEDARRLSPQAPAIAAELGRVYYQQGRLAEAVKMLEAALALDPAQANARLLLERARRRLP